MQMYNAVAIINLNVAQLRSDLLSELAMYLIHFNQTAHYSGMIKWSCNGIEM